MTDDLYEYAPGPDANRAELASLSQGQFWLGGVLWDGAGNVVVARPDSSGAPKPLEMRWTWSGDGNRVAYVIGSSFHRVLAGEHLRAGHVSVVFVRDTHTGAPIRALIIAEHIRDMSLSEDGRLLATAHGFYDEDGGEFRAPMGHHDCCVRIWDVASARLVQVLEEKDAVQHLVSFESEGRVRGFSLSKAGEAVRTTRWTLSTGAREYLDNPRGKLRSPMSSGQWAPTREVSLRTEGDAAKTDLSMILERRGQGDRRVLIAPATGIAPRVFFDAAGSHVVVGDKASWEVRALPGATVVSRGGGAIVGYDCGGGLLSWEKESEDNRWYGTLTSHGAVTRTTPTSSGVKLSPGGSHAASYDGEQSRLINLRDWVVTSATFRGIVEAVAPEAYRWVERIGKPSRQFLVGEGIEPVELEVNGHASFAFSPNGRFLVASAMNELACFDATGGALRWRAVAKHAGIFDPAFATHSPRVAFATSRGTKDYALFIDARTGAFEGQVELRRSGPLALSPDGRHLAVAYGPEVVEVYQLH